jgi:hypothetical protein
MAVFEKNRASESAQCVAIPAGFEDDMSYRCPGRGAKHSASASLSVPEASIVAPRLKNVTLHYEAHRVLATKDAIKTGAIIADAVPTSAHTM